MEVVGKLMELFGERLKKKNEKYLVGYSEVYKKRVEFLSVMFLLLDEIDKGLDRYVLEVDYKMSGENVGECVVGRKLEEVREDIRKELLPRYDRCLSENKVFLEKEMVEVLEGIRENMCIVMAYDGGGGEWRKKNVWEAKEGIEEMKESLEKEFRKILNE